MSLIYPVILSGGSGTRLWPLSRAMYPKQFIRFFGDDKPNLLTQTLSRLTGSSFAAPTVLCSNDHRFLVRESIVESGLKDRITILEPIARNTAPAIAVAALDVIKEDREAVIAVMPSDHMIEDIHSFKSSVERAAEVARSGHFVLFGKDPEEPHTGYGYIKKGALLPNRSVAVHKVDEFTEKPNREKANEYVSSGNYFWNCGIFVLQAQFFLNDLAAKAPDIFNAATKSLETAKSELEFLRLSRQAFEEAPNISVDYAVMEKTEKAAVMALNADWNDIGSWSSLWQQMGHDEAGNVASDQDILLNTSNSFIRSDQGLVCAIGVDDTIIVNTRDVTLVAQKDCSQDLSKVVAQLKDLDRKEYRQHVRNHRPWGYFETLEKGPRFQVKRIHVKSGGKLSKQFHNHRSEHWVVVKGTAKVTIGTADRVLKENDSAYINRQEWHRLENITDKDLEVIEVQFGDYLGEDDIIRSEDIYNRGPDETK